MAAHEKALIIDSLGNNWNACTVGAGVTLSALVTPAVHARVALTQLGWSFINLTGANATVGIDVRDASIAGTVLAHWDVIVAAGVSGQDNWAVNMKGLRGSPLYIGFNTNQASVKASLSVAGWIDSLSDG